MDEATRFGSTNKTHRDREDMYSGEAAVAMLTIRLLQLDQISVLPLVIASLLWLEHIPIVNS